MVLVLLRVRHSYKYRFTTSLVAFNYKYCMNTSTYSSGSRGVPRAPWNPFQG